MRLHVGNASLLSSTLAISVQFTAALLLRLRGMRLLSHMRATPGLDRPYECGLLDLIVRGCSCLEPIGVAVGEDGLRPLLGLWVGSDCGATSSVRPPLAGARWCLAVESQALECRSPMGFKRLAVPIAYPWMWALRHL